MPEWQADCGADSIGLVFHQNSPRFIQLGQALRIRSELPAFVTITALFLNEDDSWIEQVINTVKPDLLQFHGTESVVQCESWGLPYIKALAMADDIAPTLMAEQYTSCSGFLLDSHTAGRQGGSGDTFDWSRIPSSFSFPADSGGWFNSTKRGSGNTAGETLGR